MVYKSLRFTASITSNDNCDTVARQLQSIIDNQAGQGWEYVRIETVETNVASEAGCFGIGAKPNILTCYPVILFEKSESENYDKHAYREDVDAGDFDLIANTKSTPQDAYVENPLFLPEEDTSVSNEKEYAEVLNIKLTETFDKGKKILIKNKTSISIVAFSIFIFVTAYNLFLKPNPEKDAEKLVAMSCDCLSIYNEGLVSANDKFISSFDAANFKSRQEARNRLVELRSPIETSNVECNNRVLQNYDVLRSEYFNSSRKLKKFDSVFNKPNQCKQTNQEKLLLQQSQIDEKVVSINSPEPDIEKIKNDLIGQRVSGWNFEYLNEFISAEILNITRGLDRIEYQLKFHLKGVSNSEHDCEIVSVYNQIDGEWNFDKLEMLYITYTNTAPVNQWLEVKPLQNCRYSIIDQGHNYWVNDGRFGPRYKGGPSEQAFTLKSSSIFIMSREEQPVDLIFKYFPNK